MIAATSFAGLHAFDDRIVGYSVVIPGNDFQAKRGLATRGLFFVLSGAERPASKIYSPEHEQTDLRLRVQLLG